MSAAALRDQFASSGRRQPLHFEATAAVADLVPEVPVGPVDGVEDMSKRFEVELNLEEKKVDLTLAAVADAISAAPAVPGPAALAKIADSAIAAAADPVPVIPVAHATSSGPVALPDTFAGKALKTGEHLDLESEAESFVKVKLEEKEGEAGAGPAAPVATEAPRPWKRTPVTQLVTAAARPSKRQRPEHAPAEDVQRWEALVSDAFWMKSHPRMLEMFLWFVRAVRMDRATKAQEVLTTWSTQPCHWLTLVHLHAWSCGCKDRFNRIALEDLQLRTTASLSGRRRLDRHLHSFMNRPAAQEGMDLHYIESAYTRLEEKLAEESHLRLQDELAELP